MEKKFVRQALSLKGALASSFPGIRRGFVILQPRLFSDVTMGKRSFIWTGKTRVVFLVILVLVFAVLHAQAGH